MQPMALEVPPGKEQVQTPPIAARGMCAFRPPVDSARPMMRQLERIAKAPRLYFRIRDLCFSNELRAILSNAVSKQRLRMPVRVFLDTQVVAAAQIAPRPSPQVNGRLKGDRRPRGKLPASRPSLRRQLRCPRKLLRILPQSRRREIYETAEDDLDRALNLSAAGEPANTR